MVYHSTSSQSVSVGLREAILCSGTGDGSLYMPDSVPVIPKAFFNNCSGMTLREIGYVVANMLFGSDVRSDCLKKIVDGSLNFEIPLVCIEPDIFVLELFHGPTMTVKDPGARFMARLVQSFGIFDKNHPLNVMVVTSGNSGSAIANGVHGIEGQNVFVLFPRGLKPGIVSRFTSLGGNVHALEVSGSLDDCRRMMSNILSDPDVNSSVLLTSANSINIGRLLPQTILYVHAYARLLEMLDTTHADVCFSVPTGNGGNLLAALLASRMGLPVLPPIAACNVNAGFHNYLTCAPLSASTVTTTAYALDAPQPANIPRFAEVARPGDVISDVVTDQEIADTINDVYNRTGYTLDPHGAVAYRALRRKMPQGAKGIVLATAHPALSIDAMTAITGRAIELPLSLTRFMCGKPNPVKLPPTYPALKKHMLKQM